MTTEEQRLLELADAVLDARPLDWSVAVADASPNLRALAAQLQEVSKISSYHLELSVSAAADQSQLTSVDAEPDFPNIDDPAEGPFHWGPLTIVGKIGHGRFGNVYRAIDPRLDRPVALKILRRDNGGQSGVASAAIDEGRLMARVRHPNVVTVYGAERIDGRVGLWMELIEGRTLEAELRDRGPLPWQEAARIGIDLGRALAAVHRAGLLHRDLKAQNVLRDIEGRVVLADFGAGRALTGNEESAADLAGTPLYLAPEVFEGTAATERSDLYSLGVLLFHLVTGSYPVRGHSLADLREAHQQRRRTLLGQARSDFPGAFVAAVDAALSCRPEARDGLVEALEAALIAADGAGKSSSQPDSANTGRRKTIWRVLAAATAGAVAVVTALVLAAPWGGTPQPSSPAVAADTGRIPSDRKVRLPSFDMGLPSHDGKVFPYFSEQGQLQIWEVATGRTRPITDRAAPGEAGRASAASTNGDQIVYTWSLADGMFELRTIRADGTWPRVLISAQASYEPVPVDWSRDGRDILCWLRQKNGSADLVLVPVDRGTPKLIYTFREKAPQHARLSPDGRFVVTSHAADASSPKGGLLILELDAPTPRLLVHDAIADVGPQWLPDGRQVLFVRASAGLAGFDAWAVNIADGVAVGDPILARPNVGFSIIALTDGGEFYQSLTTYTAEVYTATIDLTGATAAGAPSRISAAEVGNHAGPSWSPDGRSMAYYTLSDRGIPGTVPIRTLTFQDMSSGHQWQLPLPLAFLGGYTPTWSPDGRSVVISAQESPDSQFGYHQVDIRTGQVTALAMMTGDAPPFSAFSSDGQVFFYRDPARGIVSRRIAHGTETVIMRKGDRGAIARFFLSPNNRTIAVGSSSKSGEGWISQIEIQSLDDQPRTIVRSDASTVVQVHGWTPDSRDVLYSIGQGPRPHKLMRIPAGGGSPVDLHFSSVPTPNPIVLSPDGRRIAYAERIVERELWISRFSR